MVFDGTFTAGGLMLHAARQRISRGWRTIVAVALAAALRAANAADTSPPIFPEAMSGGEIQLALQKLNVLGRVLYIAAHPDDENTNLIALWANGSLYETAYLSVTRGDGGQNLIGPELRERLGIIRTEELLAARRLDHGQQFFSRAIDFGFSKTAEETLRIWDHDKILSDVVWVIRRFRPDIVVTRFSPEDHLTHGHHTASAILAQEAFSAASDPKRFPEQLRFVKPWRATRLVWNTSPFFFSNRNLPFDPTVLTTLEDGVDTSLSRVADSESVAAKIRQIISEFHPADPGASVADLLEVRQALSGVKDETWIPEKKAELDQIIAACLGLHVEASTTNAVITPGQTAAMKLEAINRCNIPLTLREVRFPLSGDSTRIDAALPPNELVTKDLLCKIPENTPYSQPYWLRQPGTLGTFAVDDQKLIGLPENPPHLPMEITLQVSGQKLRYVIDARYRTVDPVAGELRQPLVIAPPVFTDFANGVLMFATNKAKSVPVSVTAATG